MTNCCGFNAKNLSKHFNLKVSNTDDGIKVDVTPKDKSKVESLQKFAEACRDLCEEDCC